MLGTYVNGFSVRVGNVYLFYVHLPGISYVDNRVVALLGTLFVGNYEIDFTHLSDYHTEACNVPLNLVPYDFSHAEKSDITALHHLHVSAVEVVAAQRGQLDELELDTEHVGTADVPEPMARYFTLVTEQAVLTRQLVATWVSYYAFLPDHAKRMLNGVLSQCITDDLTETRARIKAEGVRAKQAQHLYRDDLNLIFELGVLDNRSDAKIDWSAERSARVNPITVNIDENYIYREAIKMFEQGRMKKDALKYKRMDWSEYAAMRWGVLPTGAIFSQYPEDQEMIRRIDGFYRNKMTVMASHHALPFEHFYNREPQIYAKTSVKYEWGKARALYGCDIGSFLMTDFCMRMCEETLPSQCLVGSLASTENVKLAVSQMSTAIPVCYDFDDFNSQHSTEAMIAVLRAWFATYRCDMSDEQQKAMEWTISSVANQVYYCVETDETVPVRGTLFSGWRLTAFMNTVLNYIYMKRSGSTEHMMYSLHNGDDVLASCLMFTDAVKLITTAEKVGIRAQTQKMNVGTIGEFLRVDGLAKSVTASQYLTRATATFVHGRVESILPHDLLQEFEAIAMRAEEITSRGGNPALTHALEVRQARRASLRYGADTELYAHYLRLHPVQGGRNIFGVLEQQRLVKTSIDRGSADADNLAEMLDVGAQDYLNTIARRYHVDIKTISRNRIRNANRRMARACFTGASLVREERNSLDLLRSQYKVYRNTTLNRVVERVRLLGVITPEMCDNFSHNYITELLRTDHGMEYLMTVC